MKDLFHHKKLLTNSYPKLVKKSSVSTLAVRLAKEAYFSKTQFKTKELNLYALPHTTNGHKNIMMSILSSRPETS